MKISFTKPRALTLKQYRFILAYLTSGNGTQAARQAGYKGNENTLAGIALDNLRKPQIMAELAKLSNRIDKPKIATAEEVLEVLSKELRSTGDDKAHVRVRAGQLLGKRYGAFISPKEDRLKDIEILEREHSEAIKKLEREEAERRFGANVPLVQEGRFYPAGGPGVGPCGRYHAALDPALYPSSPLISSLVSGSPCPLCGGLAPVVKMTPAPSASDAPINFSELDESGAEE